MIIHSDLFRAPLLSIHEASELGVIVEANRRVFHPLGLALLTEVNGDGYRLLGFADARFDVEGITYSSSEVRVSEYRREQSVRCSAILGRRLQERRARLGFNLQPSETL